jgi:hypothetical protein
LTNRKERLDFQEERGTISRYRTQFLIFLIEFVYQTGTVKAVTIRHRIDKEANANTSWALVEMDTEEAVSAVVAAVTPPRGLLAGTNPMRIEKFSEKIAAASTGGMKQALKNITSLMGAAMAVSTK